MRQAPFGWLCRPTNPPPTHHACTPTHRRVLSTATTRSPCPTLAPPVPSQVLTLLRREGRLLPLVVYETHCKDRAQVRGDTRRTGRAPLERANCTHARDSAARSLSCLGMCAFLSSCPLPDGRAWEAGGRRARSRSPRFGQISASGVGVFPRLSHNLILTLCGTPHTHKALSSSRLHHRLRAHTRPPCARGGCRHPPMCAPHALRAGMAPRCRSCCRPPCLCLQPLILLPFPVAGRDRRRPPRPRVTDHTRCG